MSYYAFDGRNRQFIDLPEIDASLARLYVRVLFLKFFKVMGTASVKGDISLLVRQGYPAVLHFVCRHPVGHVYCRVRVQIQDKRMQLVNQRLSPFRY